MTPNQFRTARIALNYSEEEAALWLGNFSVLDWKQFESGEKPIPTEAERQIVRLVRYHRMAIDEIVRRVKEEPQTLVWYGKLEDWRLVGNRFDFLWRPSQMVARSTAALFPARVTLIPFHKEHFIEWLRHDTEDKNHQSFFNHDEATRWAKSVAHLATPVKNVHQAQTVSQ
jgi:hypothetical protein